MVGRSSDGAGRDGAVRVLCLHGTCSCGAAMRKQISRILTIPGARDKVELICIDGPMLAEKDNPMREQQEKFFKGMEFYDFARILRDGGDDHRESERFQKSLAARFPDTAEYYAHLAKTPADRLAVAEPRRYVDVDAALEYLQEQLKKHAPIHGVLGFSQGANLASLLAAQAEAGEGIEFDFVVHLCPGRPGWTSQRPAWFKKPLAMRSLHISGERDLGNPPLCLRRLYVAPHTMLHEDVHRPIPGTRAEEANRIARALVDFFLGEGELAGLGPPQPSANEAAAAAHADATAVAGPALMPEVDEGLREGAAKLTITVYIERELDIKCDYQVTIGSTIWDLKAQMSKEDPTEEAQPELFDLRRPNARRLMQDLYQFNEEDEIDELDVHIH